MAPVPSPAPAAAGGSSFAFAPAPVPPPHAPAAPARLGPESATPEALRQRGNDAFGRGEYRTAVESYTKALAADGADDETRARCLANRSAAYLKCKPAEVEGAQKLALSDALQAVQLDAAWPKAYMRLGAAWAAIGAPPLATVAYAKAVRVASDAGDSAVRQNAEVGCVGAIAQSFAGLGLRRQPTAGRALTNEDLEAVIAPGGMEALVEAFYLAIDSHAIAAAATVQLAVLAVCTEHKRALVTPLTRAAAQATVAAAAGAPNPLVTAEGARMAANEADGMINACAGRSALDALADAAAGAPLECDGAVAAAAGTRAVAVNQPTPCAALEQLYQSRLATAYGKNAPAFAAVGAFANLLEGSPPEVAREVVRNDGMCVAVGRALAFAAEVVPGVGYDAGFAAGELTAAARMAAAAATAARRMAEHADGPDAVRLWEAWRPFLLAACAPSAAFVSAVDVQGINEMELAQFAQHEALRVGGALAAILALALAAEDAAAYVFGRGEGTLDLAPALVAKIAEVLAAIPQEIAAGPALALLAAAERRGAARVREGGVTAEARVSAYTQASRRPAVVEAVRALASTAPPPTAFARSIRSIGPVVRAEARTALRKMGV